MINFEQRTKTADKLER